MVIDAALFQNPLVLAAILIIGGVILARLIRVVLGRVLQSGNLFAHKDAKMVGSLVELVIWLSILILVLRVFNINVGDIVFEKLLAVVPNLIIFLLIMLIGYIAIAIAIKLLEGFVKKVLLQDRFEEFGINKSLFSSIFMILQLFLVLVLLNAALLYSGFSLSFIDVIVNTIIVVFIVGLFGVIIFAFHKHWSNLLLAPVVRKKGIKPGTIIKIDNFVGEVASVTEKGVHIHLDDGFDFFIPNQEVIGKKVGIQRVHTNLSSFENLLTNFVAQKKSYCGPASASMILSFFGLEFSQEVIAQKAQTKVPGGNEPEEIIKAVHELTKGEVLSKLVPYTHVKNLRDELKNWLGEGALLMLWYKKPILFPDATTGHYVVGIGVNENDIIVLDPSSETGGVYTVNYNLMEGAMGKTDKERGYIIFAVKGSSAYWLLSKRITYTDANMYKSLSKGAEKHLRRLWRKHALIKDIISEHVSSKIEEPKVTPIWKPNTTKGKNPETGEEPA
ncbi:C39 family peptidase [Candidatus Micrarchaeota archaeon]|nr:C39 family peptidase [Candidatus Micrarchaeota archaeon]MBU1930554.1 C39 family peptidase [Candidatus Micrarchaeota archaeon]